MATMSLANVMDNLKEKFKNEEDEELVSPFQGLDKATVLQEVKIFSDANIVTRHPRRCCQLITKLLHILNQGEPFTGTEATDVFFGVTKLFQSKDPSLRRMMYLFIKEVADATNPSELIIVTQSLVKDMNSDTDLYRANAIRVLSRIVDQSMLTAIERYIKQAIVDRNPIVQSSALVSGIHLMGTASDVVRRWVNEVQEAVSSSNEMVQYHAILLLYKIRQHDKLAVSKMVSQLQRQNIKSPMGTVLLVRYTAALLREDLNGPHSEQFYQYLEHMLRHNNEMVIYESARTICGLPAEARANRDLGPAISVLQLLLSSNKPVLRFSALKTLNRVAMSQPMLITKANEDMETLISDPNRSIATLAITTLLKTGAESSIDRLMKQISNFMGEIADEFKIVVVEAIESLCLKYPQKFKVLLNFLANFLREEGGFEFKKTIVNAILSLIDKIPDAAEYGLLHLCEFIEDCEFTALCVQILHVLAAKGPRTRAPARYIRFIYNRIILENATIRASAVSALTIFAQRVPKLRPSIVKLLKYSMNDDDDEVRDRATVYLQSVVSQEDLGVPSILQEPLPMQPRALQLSLEQYAMRPTSGAITLNVLPHVEVSAIKTPSTNKNVVEDSGAFMSQSAETSSTNQATPAASLEETYRELYDKPEFAEYGQLFRSTPLVQLTEAETEYVVTTVKHVFEHHVVFQFNVMNTVNEQVLRNVSVELEGDDYGEVWQVDSVIPVDEAKYGENSTCYVSVKHANPDAGFPAVSFAGLLKFQVFEIDPSTGEPDEDGFDEDYPLEDLELSTVDFMAKVQVPDFRAAWSQIGDENDVREKYGLQFNSLSEGIGKIIDYLGMQPMENTDTVQSARATSHVLLLTGVFVGGVKVLVKCKLTMDENSIASGPKKLHDAILQMSVRSEDRAVSQAVADGIR